MKNINFLLKRIDRIEGLLVPGQERLLFSLASYFKGSPAIVEIGSFMGKSTACFGLGSTKSTKIYAIDTFRGNDKDFKRGIQFNDPGFFNKFENNLNQFGVRRKVFPVIGFSQEIGKSWNKKMDLLFIDGSHEYEDVKKDFSLFYKWLRPSGIVAFHDVTPAFKGVYRVWNEEARDKLVACGNIHSLYFGFKKGKETKEFYEKKVQEILGYYSNKIFVIVPVHNRLEYTERCLKSLQKQTYKNFSTIVVDDGSSDGSETFIRKNYPTVKIIKGDGNWWWTKSMAMGVNYAVRHSQNGDYVLSMNNDCFFEKNYLNEILRSSQENGRSIVGSLIVNALHKQEVIDAGVHIVWQKGLIYGIADKISRNVKFYNDRKYIKDVDTLPGKGTLIPIEVFKKIGNFRYRFLPHYLGDYEFFCRAKKYYYGLVVSSRAKLYNFSEQTGVWRQKRIEKIDFKTKINYMFGRKSKSNIADYFFFVVFACPRKYLLQNLLIVVEKFLSYSDSLHRLMIIKHNIPLYITQNKFIKSIRQIK